MDEPASSSSKQKLQLALDLRLVVLILLAVIAAMLVIWKPWDDRNSSSDRTVDVVGEATVLAEPDEYVFYPSYEFPNLTKDTALTRVSEKSVEVTAKLKELGVADNKIKSNSDGYDKYYIAPSGETPTYTLRLEISVDNKELAQKVQDYLITTSPTGQISPGTQFSDKKRKELEAQARDEATKDARAKANQTANNLGFTIGKVKSVSDGAGFGGVQPLIAEDSRGNADIAKSNLQIQPGENELRYSVSVSYYLK